jgi:hypothetical protein
MSSKTSGWWPQGRSTSKPYPRIISLTPGFPEIKPSLDLALLASGDWRQEIIEWLLDDRRKELMMERYYRDEMFHARYGHRNWFRMCFKGDVF